LSREQDNENDEKHLRDVPHAVLEFMQVL
jgi:hypothetical protein